MDKREYTYELGSYCWKVNGIVQNISEEVGLLFDTSGEEWVLLKHGDPLKVQAYQESMTKAYNAYGIPALVQHLLTISGKFPIEDLNKVISCSGAGKEFYERRIQEINDNL